MADLNYNEILGNGENNLKMKEEINFKKNRSGISKNVFVAFVRLLATVRKHRIVYGILLKTSFKI